MLEARRGDDLEDPRRLLTRVPEGVPLTSGLEDEITRLTNHDLIAQQSTDLPLQYVTVLVLARVAVKRRGERASRHWMFDQREPLRGVVTVDHEAHSDASEKPGLALPWTKHPRCGGLHLLPPLSGQICRSKSLPH